MSDQTWAVIIGAAVMVGLRVLDALVPKGYHLKWVERWMVKGDEDEDAADDEE